MIDIGDAAIFRVFGVWLRIDSHAFGRCRVVEIDVDKPIVAFALSIVAELVCATRHAHGVVGARRLGATVICVGFWIDALAIAFDMCIGANAFEVFANGIWIVRRAVVVTRSAVVSVVTEIGAFGVVV